VSDPLVDILHKIVNHAIQEDLAPKLHAEVDAYAQRAEEAALAALEAPAPEAAPTAPSEPEAPPEAEPAFQAAPAPFGTESAPEADDA